MEDFISGKDARDLIDIIVPPEAAEQQYCDSKGRRCTYHSTGDSGFSSSIQPDDVNESGTRIFGGTFLFIIIYRKIILSFILRFILKHVSRIVCHRAQKNGGLFVYPPSSPPP